MPDFSDWRFWALVGLAAVLFSPQIFGAVKWAYGKLPALNLSNQSSGSVPTTQQAFAAVEVLATYKAKCKDEPAYVGVMAATKAQLEAAG